MWIFSSSRHSAKFPCEQCGKAFISREALHNHRLQCEEQEGAWVWARTPRSPNTVKKVQPVQ